MKTKVRFFKFKPEIESEIELGQYWRNTYDNVLYMVTENSNGFSLTSCETGEAFCSNQEDIADVFFDKFTEELDNGFEFIGEVKIEYDE